MNRGFSQAFYRQRLYETVLGYKGLEDFMQNFWEKWACSKGSPLCSSHPCNILTAVQIPRTCWS